MGQLNDMSFSLPRQTKLHLMQKSALIFLRVREEFWRRRLISSSDGGSAAKIFPEFLHKWTYSQARFNSDHFFDKGLDSKEKQR